ncbi:MAG TPA: hypothetical protein VK211_07930 [Kamptonema sp.]|nr:hypothetical protein [Kamptonema sp.]
MNKTTNLLTKVTISALMFSLVFAVAAPKASAAKKLPQQKSEIKLISRASETSKQFLFPPVAIVVRTAASVVEDGELQFSELLTLNGLALAASGLVGIRRFRQSKKVTPGA